MSTATTIDHATELAKLACQAKLQVKSAGFRDSMGSIGNVGKGALLGAAVGGGGMALADLLRNKKNSSPVSSGLMGAILGGLSGAGVGHLVNSRGKGFQAITDPHNTPVPLPNGKSVSLKDVNDKVDHPPAKDGVHSVTSAAWQGIKPWMLMRAIKNRLVGSVPEVDPETLKVSFKAPVKPIPDHVSAGKVVHNWVGKLVQLPFGKPGGAGLAANKYNKMLDAIEKPVMVDGEPVTKSNLRPEPIQAVKEKLPEGVYVQPSESAKKAPIPHELWEGEAAGARSNQRLVTKRNEQLKKYDRRANSAGNIGAGVLNWSETLKNLSNWGSAK